MLIDFTTSNAPDGAVLNEAVSPTGPTPHHHPPWPFPHTFALGVLGDAIPLTRSKGKHVCTAVFKASAVTAAYGMV